MKFCYKCETHKDYEDFSKNRKARDGRGYYCKDCNRKYYNESKNKPPVIRREMGSYYRENKDKQAARMAVFNAIKEGLLTRNPCSICGDEKSEGHHESYREDKRLDVIWLCKLHHIRRHRDMRRAVN